MLRRTFNTLLGLFFLPKLSTIQSEEPFSYCEEVVIEEVVDKFIKKYREYTIGYNIKIDLNNVSIYDDLHVYRQCMFGVYGVASMPYYDIYANAYYTPLERLGAGRKEYEQFINSYRPYTQSRLAKEIERRIRSKYFIGVNPV